MHYGEPQEPSPTQPRRDGGGGWDGWGKWVCQVLRSAESRAPPSKLGGGLTRLIVGTFSPAGADAAAHDSVSPDRGGAVRRFRACFETPNRQTS